MGMSRFLALGLVGGVGLLLASPAAARARAARVEALDPMGPPLPPGGLDRGQALASGGSGGALVPVSSVGPSGGALREIPRAAGVPIWEAAKNPGNLRYSAANDWVGQVGWVVSASGARFAAFSGFEYGLRAAAIIIGRDVQAGKTLRQIVHEFAPAHENDTAGYMAELGRLSGVGADQVPSMWKLGPLVVAFARIETGRDFSGLMPRALAMTGFGALA